MSKGTKCISNNNRHTLSKKTLIMENNNCKNISRRKFLKTLGIAGATVTAASALGGCAGNDKTATATQGSDAQGEMTYRTNRHTGDRVSILGFGMMRLPWKKDNENEIDQELVNQMVDYAFKHGVNYFDTSPAYCQGKSETATGIALSKYPRDSYFVATKMSNFARSTWPYEKSVEMYRNSLKALQVDYIDYMLLHSVGNGGMEEFDNRYIKNGILDFLLKEREAGRIRNIGFSFHGDVEVFDTLLAQNDKYHWDFVQIQMNYLDWKHAKEINERNVDAEYLYNELVKHDIQAVIMEPLLGGRLSNLPDNIVARLKQQAPEKSTASWAFRFAGTYPDVLTVLSGMTRMEHLQDNLLTYSPLVPLTDDELDFLQETATLMMQYPTIPCNDCKYCMPCPYGIDIPAILLHYNKCLNEGNIVANTQSDEYRKARRAYLIGYDRSVPKLRQANHCIGCNQCSPHCPQSIDIPKELHRIDSYVEQLKQNDGTAVK